MQESEPEGMAGRLQPRSTVDGKDRVVGVDTTAVDDATARNPVSELVDTDVVAAVPEDQVPVHEPSSTAFDSTIQLAVFHRGWMAARDADSVSRFVVPFDSGTLVDRSSP